jgi:four helix bundle protein
VEKRDWLCQAYLPIDEQFGLSSQLRRASVAIPSNIAEGQARYHNKEFSHFLRIALGSLAEVDTQLVIGEELGYFSGEDCSSLGKDILELRRMIYGLIKSLSPN